jgi:hypothetical protein
MKKVILSLTNSNLKFKPVVKDRLFYNRFEYAISFTLDEASALRDLSHEEIDLTMERRREWRDIAQQRWYKTGTILGSRHQNILSRRRKEITTKTVDDLHLLAETLLTATADYKLVVSVNQGHVYTNDLGLIDQLNQFDFLTKKYYSQAEVNRPQNTIRLKNPRHKFRSYFKITKLTADQKDQLMSFLFNQKDYVRLSPALQQWVDQPFNRTQDYFFIDHNEMSWLTMLGLVRPGIIRKTQEIIQAK